LNGRVEFTGPRAPDALVAEYRTAGLLINSSPTGALDKVVLEAMACGTPAVVGNRSFSAELDESDRWLVCEPTPEQVAEAWTRIASLSPSDRDALGRRLRSVVEERHSLDRLADRIVAELEAARG
jgi:glycosyltransferase involved in cell wall biosynthesis